MRRAWFRSTIFNIAFFIATAVLCVGYIPALLLPRTVFTGLVRVWVYVVTALEYSLLGLSYEIRGAEFLPKQGPYIIAAKHQSMYETIKLRLLFPDPAIILKQELLKIPLWGNYLKKSGVIAIDRSTPERALKSIEQGAVQMAQDGRPIVIFVQGTRVWPHETPTDKPYKAGVARIQQATNLPIIPMALNSGLYWPRSGWLKSSGKVVFEFLEPIEPGMERRDLLTHLEEVLEDESSRLMNESRAVELTERTSSVKTTIASVLLCAVAIAGYCYLWSETAKQVKNIYIGFMTDVAEVERIHAEPVVSGFPGAITMKIANESLSTSQGSVKIEDLTLRGWPIPFIPVHITTGPITVRSIQWGAPLTFDSFEAWATYFARTLNIKASNLHKGNFVGKAAGRIDLRQEPYPAFDMTISLENYAEFLAELVRLHILEEREAMFMTAGFSLLARDNVVTLPVTRKNDTLYAGPLPVATLPAASPTAEHPELRSQPALDQ